jgi:hypothetical protein
MRQSLGQRGVLSVSFSQRDTGTIRTPIAGDCEQVGEGFWTRPFQVMGFQRACDQVAGSGLTKTAALCQGFPPLNRIKWEVIETDLQRLAETEACRGQIGIAQLLHPGDEFRLVGGQRESQPSSMMICRHASADPLWQAS